MVGKKKSHYPVSDHYNGKTFFNPGVKIRKSFLQLMKMLRERRRKRKTWPKFVLNTATPQLANKLDHTQAAITYVNHASHLIQLQNLNIITDPIFSKRAGPFALLGPKRVRKPGIGLKDLPSVDVVLVSHNHYDHMDMRTLKKLNNLFKPLFIVPLGNKKYFTRRKIHKVIELDWWQTHTLTENQTITLVPAQHWSMRTMNDTNKALWGGYWIRSHQLNIYFAGDTGFGEHFKLIKEKMGRANISILPIGAYEPRWFMKPQHMNPEDAVQASLILETKLAIATHHQTFRLATEGFYEPKQSLQHNLVLNKINPNYFLAPDIGETINYTA
jgi:L-ascorbate metabolism protein UlaG (beta-lactamase superfamily)